MHLIVIARSIMAEVCTEPELETAPCGDSRAGQSFAGRSSESALLNLSS